MVSVGINFLKNHKSVKNVIYPGFHKGENLDRTKKYLCQDPEIEYDFGNLNSELRRNFFELYPNRQSPHPQRILASMFGMRKVENNHDIKQKFELLLSKSFL